MELEALRSYCLSLPAVTEDIKWGNDLVFSIGQKMFCVIGFEPPFTYSFKANNELFEELSLKEGFKPAPYLARAKWILVTKPGLLNKTESQKLIRESYELVKAGLTKKLRAALGI
ncbi:MAG TPA: MmcQ/YjbR family DNA-binding protein [Flavisolibacter sp.]|nr:MmcQ/YjbR family DNA-binding protein [Flavisolibacter sp.]